MAAYRVWFELNVDEIANLVNYGALFGFAWLNLSVIVLYFQGKHNLLYQSSKQQLLHYVVFPLIGFIVVAWVFLSLNTLTHLLGTIWLVIGAVYICKFLKIHTKNFIL